MGVVKEFRDFAVKGNAMDMAVAVRYGLFINTLIDFLIVAFTIFMVIRTLNRLATMRPPFLRGEPAAK